MSCIRLINSWTSTLYQFDCIVLCVSALQFSGSFKNFYSYILPHHTLNFYGTKNCQGTLPCDQFSPSTISFQCIVVSFYQHIKLCTTMDVTMHWRNWYSASTGRSSKAFLIIGNQLHQVMQLTQHCVAKEKLLTLFFKF